MEDRFPAPASPRLRALALGLALAAGLGAQDQGPGFDDLGTRDGVPADAPAPVHPGTSFPSAGTGPGPAVRPDDAPPADLGVDLRADGRTPAPAAASPAPGPVPATRFDPGPGLDKALGSLTAMGTLAARAPVPVTALEAELDLVRQALHEAARNDPQKLFPGVWQVYGDLAKDLDAVAAAAPTRWALDPRRLLDAREAKQELATLRARITRLAATVRLARHPRPLPAAPVRPLRPMPVPGSLALAAGAGPEVTVTTPGGRRRVLRAFPGARGPEVRIMPEGDGVYRIEGRGQPATTLTLQGSARAPAVDPDSKKVFRDGQGRLFAPLGMNLGWVLEGLDAAERFAAIERYFERMAAYGARWVRMWSCAWSFDFEPRLGRYDEEAAATFERVLQAAARRGIYVQLCLTYHGILKADAQWHLNAYNRANGGPCATPVEFFSSRAARDAFKKRLDWLVARFAAQPALFAWELVNEVNLVDGYPTGFLAANDWHREMSEYLHRIDPYGHMVSTSTAFWQIPTAGLWKLPGLDFVQTHEYQNHFIATLDVANNVMGRFGKPVLNAEAGYDFRSPSFECSWDPEGILFHRALLKGIFSGGAGSAMAWWWDSYVAGQDLFPRFGPVAEVFEHFEAGARWPEETQAAFVGLELMDVEAESLAAPDRAALWLEDEAHAPAEGLTGPPALEPRGPFEVVLPIGRDGRWSVTWLDPWTGRKTSLGTHSAALGRIRFRAPPFTRDALYLATRVP